MTIVSLEASYLFIRLDKIKGKKSLRYQVVMSDIDNARLVDTVYWGSSASVALQEFERGALKIMDKIRADMGVSSRNRGVGHSQPGPKYLDEPPFCE